MALVNLNEVSINKSIPSGNYLDSIPYYLYTDTGPTHTIQVTTLSQLRSTFYPSTITSNYLTAEKLIELGYKLIIKRINPSSNYTSLRIIEGHTETIHLDLPTYESYVPPRYKTIECEIGDESYYFTSEELNQVYSTNPADLKTIEYPRFVTYPEKGRMYELNKIPYSGYLGSRLVNVDGDKYKATYAINLSFSIDELSSLNYLMMSRANEVYPSGSIDLVIFTDDSIQENEPIDLSVIGIDPEIIKLYIQGVPNYTKLYLPGSLIDVDGHQEIVTTERFINNLFNAFSNLGYSIYSYEYTYTEEGNISGFKNLVLTSTIPISLAEISIVDQLSKFLPISENSSVYQDMICSGFDDHKVIDIFSKYPRNQDNLSVRFQKLITGDYTFTVICECDGLTDTESFLVNLNPSSDIFINKVVFDSRYVEVNCYKSDYDISGVYKLGRVGEKLPEQIDEVEAIKLIQQTNFDKDNINIVTDCDLTESIQDAIYEKFNQGISLNLFTLHTNGIHVDKSHHLMYFRDRVILGDVSYPTWILTLGLIKTGLFCGEVFPDNIIRDNLELTNEYPNLSRVEFDNYRYLIPSTLVYDSIKLVPPEMILLNTRLVTKIIPSIDMFSSAMQINTALEYGLNNEFSLSLTKILGIAINSVVKDRRNVRIEYTYYLQGTSNNQINLTININI